MKVKDGINPFYVLLAVVGVLFVITVCAYGVMTVQQMDPARLAEAAERGAQPNGLLVVMDRHGVSLLAIELVVLAICTLAAIGTDEFWSQRAARRRQSTSESHVTRSKTQS